MKKYVFLLAAVCACLVILTGFFVLNKHAAVKKPIKKHNLYAHMLWSPRLKIKPKLLQLANVATQTSLVNIDQPVATTGCSAAVKLPLGQTSAVTITSNKIQRTYFIYLPSNFDNSVQHSLILNFHGYAANGLDEERISQFLPIANSSNVILVYPNGTFDRFGFRGWNTGLHPSITSNDVLFVSDLLNQLQSNFCINQNEIYATGFSNGGGFVNLLACKLSNRIAAFAPVSGSYVTPFKLCDVTRAVPIIEFHGSLDESVPYNGDIVDKELSVLTWLTHWIKADGCADQPTILFNTPQVIEYSWPKCNSESAVVHYKVLGERHTWPFISFPQNVNGQVLYQDAATVIWNFFQSHPLPEK